MTRVLLATSSTWPDLDDDGPALLAALAARGVSAAPAVWDDPDVDWAAADLVVVRSTWDYSGRRDEFLAWAGSVPRLANPLDVLTWSSDKRYLRDLAAAGVPVVPTTWLEPGDAVGLPGGEVVVKPAVSAGAMDTARYADDDPAAADHAARLLAAGRVVMVQPYVEAVDTAGETALLFTGGGFSHGVRKGPLLRLGDGAGGGVASGHLQEDLAPRSPTDEEHAVAEAALAAVPGGHERLLYARVDLLPTADGPVVLELELVEPSLFLGLAGGAVDRFAGAVAAAAGRRTPPG